jgi:hypothetical protein
LLAVVASAAVAKIGVSLHKYVGTYTSTILHAQRLKSDLVEVSENL